jgi:hypothetical protein
MAELKTRPTDARVADYLNGLEDDAQRDDAWILVDMMRGATSVEPRMWGPGIVGFGSYTYPQRGGEAEWFVVGFAPRKRELTLYLTNGVGGAADDLARLGKCRTGKACLYIKRLSDVDLVVLGEMIQRSVDALSAQRTS